MPAIGLVTFLWLVAFLLVACGGGGEGGGSTPAPPKEKEVAEQSVTNNPTPTPLDPSSTEPDAPKEKEVAEQSVRKNATQTPLDSSSTGEQESRKQTDRTEGRESGSRAVVLDGGQGRQATLEPYCVFTSSGSCKALIEWWNQSGDKRVWINLSALELEQVLRLLGGAPSMLPPMASKDISQAAPAEASPSATWAVWSPFPSTLSWGVDQGNQVPNAVPGAIDILSLRSFLSGNEQNYQTSPVSTSHGFGAGLTHNQTNH